MTLPSSTDVILNNWQAILDRLAEDTNRLHAAFGDPTQLEDLLLAGVGRMPPPPGAPLPASLRAYAEAVLGRMDDLEHLLATAATRLSHEARDELSPPAFYIDTNA
jgi:hypothetical protein